MIPFIRTALVLSAASTLLACGTTRGQAKELGASALSCPMREVELESFGGASYVVSGCGHSVDVECVDPRTVDRTQQTETRSNCRAGKVR